MKIGAIILARGGSKGIPGKNIIDFLGKPLLAWTIEQCLHVKSIDNVWVSSDNQDILDVAETYGARTIKRPAGISDDKATSESGWLHALSCLEKNNIEIDMVLAPQVTSPLREPKDMELAIDYFKRYKFDSLFSSSEVNDLYYWNIDCNGILHSINYDYRNRKRRQDFKKQIIENGSFYLFKPENLRKDNNRLGGKIGNYKMESWKMFEIDHMDDVRVCSALMKEFLIEEKV